MKSDYLKPKKVILHCAVTPDDNDRLGANDIDRWHREKGWEKIGYHYVIKRSGIIEAGRSLVEIGAHCRGHNNDAIGICYMGTHTLTYQQIESLTYLYSSLKFKFDIDWQDWFGHYEFDDKKTCPNQDMNVIRTLLKGYKNGLRFNSKL